MGEGILTESQCANSRDASILWESREAWLPGGKTLVEKE